MRRGTKVFLAVFLVILLLFGAAAAMSVWFYAKPRVAKGSLLLVDLSGSIVEYDAAQELREIFGERVTSVSQVIDSVLAAKDDERIEGLLLLVDSPVGLDPAKAWEIRSALEAFRASGKPTHAYMEFAGTIPYYVASACENVYLMPQGQMWTTGFYGSHPHLKRTLEKVRIRPDFYAFHEYKSAADMYRREEMSDTNREQLDALMDNWYGHFRDGVAASRRLEPEQVDQAVDNSPMIPDEALEAGFVDAILYWDQVRDRLDGEVDGEEKARFTSVRNYRRNIGGGGGDRIAVIYAIGVILPGESQESIFGATVMGSDTMARSIREAREDDSIKAIVLRVDSPGGSAQASEEIWREVERTRESGKPIVVSMSWVAASGGYWISMAADEIVAGPTTVTGSIGVVAGKLDWSGFYDWIGMNWEGMARGRNAGMFTDTQGFSATQAERMQAWMTHVYDEFVRKVADGRGLDEEKVREIARGRVWSGEAALELGLVDRLGGLREAIQAAKERAGIPASQRVSITTWPRAKSLWESLFGDPNQDRKIYQSIPGPLRETLGRAAIWEQWEEEGALALDPSLWGFRLEP